MMQTVGELLNLQPHLCGQVDPKTVYTCGDVEGHLGNDSRYYVLDCARIFPPETPLPDRRGANLYRLLRPEFVKKYHRPLSSDAFSGFQHPSESKELNQAVADATLFLWTQVIPEAAVLLDKMHEELILTEDFSMTEFMHRQGINMRYLGRILRHLLHKQTQEIALVEILARSAVKILNNRMRALDSTDSEDYLVLVVQFLKDMFWPEQHSFQKFWSEILPTEAAQRFESTLTVRVPLTYSLLCPDSLSTTWWTSRRCSNALQRRRDCDARVKQSA
jgi:hypothetical protein